jgi:2-polyprenyl-3-methyl-5-hydroxy-6-metoxy-1,4-benzoquinol methylase
MAEASRRAHWDEVYTSRGETDVSWFQDNPALSLELIERARGGRGTLIGGSDIRIIDVGGGASRLADGLLTRGFRDLTVLDISATALDLAALRLGRRASEVQWITADVTEWQPSRRFDVWHDRAVFHFLVDPADRAAYVSRLKEALVPGGHAIIATFAADGPDTCSGLPVRRYDAGGLGAELGAEFTLVESRPHDHVTPWNSSQRFQSSVFQRQNG